MAAQNIAPTPGDKNARCFFRSCFPLGLSLDVEQFCSKCNPKALRTTTSEVALLPGQKKLGAHVVVFWVVTKASRESGIQAPHAELLRVELIRIDRTLARSPRYPKELGTSDSVRLDPPKGWKSRLLDRRGLERFRNGFSSISQSIRSVYHQIRIEMQNAQTSYFYRIHLRDFDHYSLRVQAFRIEYGSGTLRTKRQHTDFDERGISLASPGGCVT